MFQTTNQLTVEWVPGVDQGTCGCLKRSSRSLKELFFAIVHKALGTSQRNSHLSERMLGKPPKCQAFET